VFVIKEPYIFIIVICCRMTWLELFTAIAALVNARFNERKPIAIIADE